MTNSTDLPAIPAKRYFTLEEACRLANVRPDRLREWQREGGGIIGKGGSLFTRLDVMKLRQLQHGISDCLAQDRLGIDGKPAITADEMRYELESMLSKIEKTLAN